MATNFRIVGCIPAGRKRYLELQVPHLLRARNLFSEIQLWANTAITADIKYLHELENRHPDLFRVIKSQTPPKGNETICPFWRGTTDPDAIYIRTDDDIIWIDSEAFERLVAFRIANPDPFLIFGNIINNAVCSYLHQRQGCIPASAGITTLEAMCSLGWRSAAFAEEAHRSFLQHLALGTTENYLFNRWNLDTYQRFGINVCCWFGRDFGPQDPEEMNQNEEHWVSCVRPRQLGRPNAICGSALFSHFAYYTQRYGLDRTDLLEQYRRFSPAVSA